MPPKGSQKAKQDEPGERKLMLALHVSGEVRILDHGETSEPIQSSIVGEFKSLEEFTTRAFADVQSSLNKVISEQRAHTERLAAVERKQNDFITSHGYGDKAVQQVGGKGHMSDKERKEYTAAFKEAAGCEPSIQLNKVKHIFRRMGFDPVRYPNEIIDDWLVDVDYKRNDDYRTDVNEFLAVVEKRTDMELLCARVRRFFKKLDDDNSGTVTKEEIVSYLERRGKGQNAEAKMQKMLSNVDFDGNGEITLGELLAAVLVKQNTGTLDSGNAGTAALI